MKFLIAKWKLSVAAITLILSLTVVPNAILASASTARVGVYGPLALTGQVWNSTTTNWFAQSKLDWIWAQPTYPYTGAARPYADILKAAGKRIILRTYFWDAPALSGATWTTLKNKPSLYDSAVAAMAQQINNVGQANLYAVTISEEEPDNGYGWGTINATDYIYGQNILYTRLKAQFPTLKIFENPQIGELTDAQVKSLKMDGIEAHIYNSDPAKYNPFYARLVNLGSQMGLGQDVFTTLHASPGSYYEPPCDVTYLPAAFAAALNAGISNVGFYAETSLVQSPAQHLVYGTYADDSSRGPMLSIFRHQQVIFSLLNQYANTALSPTPILKSSGVPSPTPTPTPVSTLTPNPTPTPVGNRVAHWKFDESSGTAARDSAGSNTGSVHSATWTTGQSGSALSFNGSNSYVNCGSGSGFNLTSKLSLEAWIKVPYAPSSDREIIQKGPVDWAKENYYLELTPSMTVRFGIGNGSTYNSVISKSSAPVMANNWYHIVGVADGSSLKIYLNGVLQGTTVQTITPAPNSAPVKISVPYSGLGFKGLIDEVSIYNTAIIP